MRARVDHDPAKYDARRNVAKDVSTQAKKTTATSTPSTATSTKS